MSEQTETPSLFPEEGLPKKKATRRKTADSATAATATTPRKPRATKTKAASEETPVKPVKAKTAKATKTVKAAAKATAPVAAPEETAKAPKAAKATKAIKPAAAKPAKSDEAKPAPRKRAVKKAAEPAPVESLEPVKPAAPVAIEPIPAPAPEPIPAAADVFQAPISRQPEPAADQRRGGRGYDRGDRGDRGNRRGRDRNNQRGGQHRRDRESRPGQQQQSGGPQAPIYAGAPVEEWSPRSRNDGGPSAPAEPAQQQPAPARPVIEELIIPRRQRPLEGQPAPQGAPGMSREERIAAARQQFRTSEPPLQAGEAQAAPVPEGPRSEPVFAEGIIEVSGKGFGFLRDPKRSFAQHPSDVFVTPEVCRRYNLRDGVWIKGEIRRGNRGPQLFRLTEIEGEDPEKFRNLPMFDELTTINPNHFLKLETTPERTTTRVIDLMAPIGRGQRGLIVAPPRTGKTTFLQHIAEAVVKNHPDMKLIILLVDERPEEVTDLKRSFPGAEVMASSNDQEIKSHTRIAQLAVERARRLVEMGKHVFILLDSITRVGRAFNNAMGGGGRTMSGGVDARALEIPRKLFAAARNTEEAGSLTIVATALIETGSRMDDLIFQEFKGTGNMELVLDRKISDLRVYPAVDIFASGTRREELLLPETDLHKINIIRRGLSGHKPVEAIERLLFFLNKFPTNSQMLREIPG